MYQPIVDAATGTIVKAEALVRWPHMGRGPVPPPEFISLAEETGMIVPLSRAVFERVCADIAEWGATLPPDFRISVNLSGVNFMDAQLIPTVRTELERAGVPASRIEFELTETVLMRDLDYATNILAQLRDMGVRVAVDDFGTGYLSNLMLIDPKSGEPTRVGRKKDKDGNLVRYAKRSGATIL